MLTATSPPALHFLQNVLLIFLSLALFPLSTAFLLLSYALRPLLSNHEATRRRIRYSPRTPTFHPRTILITGVGMSKGLALARSFYLAGHNVIGADFEPYRIPSSGRFSKAVGKYYALPKPNEQDGPAVYINALLQLVQIQHVDIWVSCSGVASAVEDGLAHDILSKRTSCASIQFSASTTSTLHSKDTFIAQTTRLNLPVPETHNVTSRQAVHTVLHGRPTADGRRKKRYIMKSVGVDDASRADMTLLPRRTLSQTYEHIARLPISASTPYVLQEFVAGREYCTHSLIINGHVRVFVACPSSELLMHYSALPESSALRRAMLEFTRAFVHRSEGGTGWTGHLSFDFLVEERVGERGAEAALVPIECNPRAHTAVVLFKGREKEVVEAYLGVLEQGKGRALGTNGHFEGEGGVEGDDYEYVESEHAHIVTPSNPPQYYWIGHDIIMLLLLPLLNVLQQKTTLDTCLRSWRSFLEHLLFWKDGTYELWDPLPAWWLYHVYWPGQFVGAIIGRKRWSRVNVSTGKVFRC